MLAAPSAAIDLPPENSCRGKFARQGVALLQQPGLPERAARFAGQSVAEHRRRSGVWRPPLASRLGEVVCASSFAAPLSGANRRASRITPLACAVRTLGESQRAGGRYRKARCGMTGRKPPTLRHRGFEAARRRRLRPRGGLSSRRSGAQILLEPQPVLAEVAGTEDYRTVLTGPAARKLTANAPAPPSTTGASASTWLRRRSRLMPAGSGSEAEGIGVLARIRDHLAGKGHRCPRRDDRRHGRA